MNCVPETQQSQQAAGVEELVGGGVQDPLLMSDTAQGDILVEPQHGTVSSKEDTQDTCYGDTEGQRQEKGQVIQGRATCIGRDS